MSELAKKLAPEAETMEEETAEEMPAFVVDNDAKAEWCLQKKREKMEELEKWKAHYAGLLDAVKKEIEESISYFDAQLAAYFDQQQAAGLTKATKTQCSYPLPSGKLVMKHQEPTYTRDPEQLLPWLKQNHPELVKVKEEEDWAGLKKLLIVDGENMITEDAEIVPGITVTARPDIFKAEVK